MGNLVPIGKAARESLLAMAENIVDNAHEWEGALLIYKNADGQLVLSSACVEDGTAVSWLELTKTQVCRDIVGER